MEPEKKNESALEEAQRLVHGARGGDYGHPLDDFSRTAKLWTPILGCPVSAEQVGLCMIQVKISREIHKPRRDNRVDIAGYAETLQMIAVERELRSSLGNMYFGITSPIIKKSAAKRRS